MSTTSSPTRPARSPTPVLNEEDTEIQAFLAAAQREAQEKWRRLREEKAMGSIVIEQKDVEEDEVVEKGVNAVVKVQKEVVPKVELKPRKVTIRMVAGLPRGREMIPVIPVLKKRPVEPVAAESSHKRRKVVQSPVMVDSGSDSIPVPVPRPCEHCVCSDQVCRPQPNAPNAVACDRCHVARQSCSFLRKSRRARVKTPPSESELVGVKGEMRELRFAIKELTEQVHALMRQGRRVREGRGDHREDRKGKGKWRETTPETDRYSLE
ncbi:hypothetical protein GGU11DRAFT_749976 [Lentinula aff. detonsa]|nr:hypothetical protein GGU11DRAFT_749976 [Lentinula aff. detonsa]